MISSVFGLVLSVFTSDLIAYCCAGAYILGCFGLIRRFIIGDYRLER